MWGFVRVGFCPVGFCQCGVLSCGVLSVWVLSVWGFVLWGFVLDSCLCPLDLEHCINLLKLEEELGMINKILMKTRESQSNGQKITACHFNDILLSLQYFITV